MASAASAAPQVVATRPDGLRKLRACIGCKLIKTHAQFMTEFCDNWCVRG